MILPNKQLEPSVSIMAPAFKWDSFWWWWTEKQVLVVRTRTEDSEDLIFR